MESMMSLVAFYGGVAFILVAVWTLLQALITRPYRTGNVANLLLRPKGVVLTKETQVVASIALLAIGSFAVTMSHPLIPSWLAVVAAFIAIVLMAGLHLRRNGA